MKLRTTTTLFLLLSLAKGSVWAITLIKPENAHKPHIHVVFFKQEGEENRDFEGKFNFNLDPPITLKSLKSALQDIFNKTWGISIQVLKIYRRESKRGGDGGVGEEEVGESSNIKDQLVKAQTNGQPNDQDQGTGNELRVYFKFQDNGKGPISEDDHEYGEQNHKQSILNQLGQWQWFGIIVIIVLAITLVGFLKSSQPPKSKQPNKSEPSQDNKKSQLKIGYRWR